MPAGEGIDAASLSQPLRACGEQRRSFSPPPFAGTFSQVQMSGEPPPPSHPHRVSGGGAEGRQGAWLGEVTLSPHWGRLGSCPPPDAFLPWSCCSWSTCRQKQQLAKARVGELAPPPEGEKLHSDSGVFLDTHSLQEHHPLTKGKGFVLAEPLGSRLAGGHLTVAAEYSACPKHGAQALGGLWSAFL